MTYIILFLCFNNEKLNLKHETNDYDQAEHFYWAMVLKLKQAHDKIDTNQWQLTLQFEQNGKTFTKYHFSKT